MTSASGGAHQDAVPALRAGDELLRRYFDLGLIGMAITSPTKRIVEVNDEICRVLGYDRHELLQMTWAELTHPDDLEYDVTNFNLVMAGKSDGYSLDKRWIRKDGTIVHGSISVKCVRDEDGAVDFFVALLQDLTERRRMEETLRARELFIQRIADLTPAALSVFDLVTQRDTYISPYVVTLLGYTRDEMARMEDNVEPLCHPDDIPMVAAYITRSRDALDGQVSEIEYRARRRDGEWRWLLSRGMPFSRDESGKVRQNISITTDVTERRAAKDRAAVDLAGMKLLQDVATRLARTERLEPLLQEILRAATEITGTDKGNIQLVEPETGLLRIVAHQGLNQRFLDHFRTVDESRGSCGAAARAGDRVVVEDVTESPIFKGTADLDVMIDAGARAVQSTPLPSRDGQHIGIISTHFSTPHTLTEAEVPLLDLLARQAADAIDQVRADERLRRAHEDLEQKVLERTAQLTISNTLLGEAHLKLELILNSVTDNVFSLSKDWRFAYLNTHARAQMRKLGKDPAELIGAVLWEEFPEIPNADTLRRVMSERIAITDEFFYAPLGEWVENHMYPTADGGLLTLQRYITERKRMEMDLQRSEAYLADAQRLSHTGSGVWNVQNGQLWWSRETYWLYGFDPSKVTLTVDLFMSIVHPADRARLEREGERVVRERTGYELEFRIIRPDGAVRYMHSVGHPLFDASGTFTEVLGTVMDITDSRHAEDERARLLRSLITAQEEECRRISHEMHDQFGQQLSVLMMKIGALKAACSGHVELCAQIDSLEVIARNLDADVDFLVRNIRPTALDDLGLPIALSNFVASWKAHFGVNADLHISGMEFDRLNSEMETVLYRVLQEALTNIGKHASAAHVDILLERHPDHVSLIVEDDGAGFDVDQPGGGRERGLGVVGMRERAALVGGSLDIESRPGKGTTVVVRIPTIPTMGA